jgi:hypothetical protein
VATPTIVFRTSDVNKLFDLERTELSASLDMRSITKQTDYLIALSSLIAMYWAMDVEFPAGLKERSTFWPATSLT